MPLVRSSIVALAAVLAGTVGAQPLTLDHALQLAQARSRQLDAQHAAAASARELAVAAGQRPDPVLKAGVSNLPVNGPDAFSLTRDFMTMRSLGVMQELTRGDKLRARSERVAREADLAAASRQLTLANLQRDTALAWLDRHYLERMRELLAAQRDEARLQVDAAEAAQRGGRGAQADVFAARSAVAQLEDRLAQAERQSATALTQLARWIGEAATQPLAPPPPTDTVSAELDAETVPAHHPQIALMRTQEDAARADVAIAQANRQPDWTAELMVSQRGPAYSNMVSFNVSLPLAWNRRDRQDRELAAKLAVAEQMRAQREEGEREHAAETRAMLLEWRSDRERLVRYDATLLPLGTQRTQAALAAYRGGSTPLAAVLEARRMEIDLRMERLRLEMEAARLWAQLSYLVPAGHEGATP